MAHPTGLGKQLKKVERQIRRPIESTPELKKKAQRLESVPAIGQIPMNDRQESQIPFDRQHSRYAAPFVESGKNLCTQGVFRA